MTLKEQIAVMKAFHDGALIESRPKYSHIECCWCDSDDPSWNWLEVEYRVKPVPKILRKNLIDDIRNHLDDGLVTNTKLAGFHRKIFRSSVRYDKLKQEFYED